jgi:chorismate synthase
MSGEIGGDAIDMANFDAAQIRRNPFFCPDAAAASAGKRSWTMRVDGSSVGAVVECVATGVPAGWGAPLYAKLDPDLAAAMMSINAVKGVEIGDGFAAARAANRTPTRCIPARRAAGFRGQPRGRHRGRHFHGPAGGGARGLQADQLDPDPVPTITREGSHRTVHQGPP